jgi:hypothetical protein
MRQIARESNDQSPSELPDVSLPVVGEVTPLGLLNSRLENMHSHGKVTFGRAYKQDYD